jgi:hypothetical protein
MKDLAFDIESIIIGAILLTMEIGYCIIRDTIEKLERILKKY